MNVRYWLNKYVLTICAPDRVQLSNDCRNGRWTPRNVERKTLFKQSLKITDNASDESNSHNRAMSL